MGKRGKKRRKRMPNDAQILLRVPAELRRTLEERADLDERSLADYCRLILKRYVEGKGR